MNKTILLLLFLLPMLVFGQMKISTGKQNGIYYKLYEPKTPSKNYLIFLHGKGQLGNTYGTTINLVEQLGYPAAAKAGYEFDFNIIAFQIPLGQFNDFWMIQTWAVNWVKETLGADKIVVTGLSLGGRGTWTLLRYDTKGYIDAIAPICGYYNSGEGPIKDLRSVVGYSWHGDQDTEMVYSWNKGGIDLYNQTHAGTQVIDGITRPLHYLYTDVGAGHNVWVKAYDVNGPLLKWIKNIFGPPPVVVEEEVSVFYDKSTGKLTYKNATGEVVKTQP